MKKVELRLKKLTDMINCPTRRSRQGWREAFMAEGAPDREPLLLENIEPNDFDLDEWKW